MAKIIAILLVIFLPLLGYSQKSDDAVFTFKKGDQKIIWKTSELAKRPDKEILRVEKDPASDNKPMEYIAIPLHHLFKDRKIPSDGTLDIKALDGMYSVIPTPRLLNEEPSSAIAYLAFQPKNGSWPLTKKGVSIGPFYLIWKNPQLSNISSEEWPFMIESIEAKGSFAATYPRTVPRPPVDPSVQNGYALFKTNCFPCHTLNKEGAAQMGPDLNVPLSPTDYFAPGYLKKYIRDPRSLRHWSKSMMPAFDNTKLKDAELDDLIAYLKHMAKNR